MYLLRQAYVGDAIDLITGSERTALNNANKVAEFVFDG